MSHSRKVCPNCGYNNWDGDLCISCWWDPSQEHFMPHFFKKKGERGRGMTYDEWVYSVESGWPDER